MSARRPSPPARGLCRRRPGEGPIREPLAAHQAPAWVGDRPFQLTRRFECEVRPYDRHTIPWSTAPINGRDELACGFCACHFHLACAGWTPTLRQNTLNSSNAKSFSMSLVETQQPIRIAVWSGPRNISTALMRSWGNRSDTVVCDEPLYAYYLKTTRKQ